jgi:hypothetical protein
MEVARLILFLGVARDLAAALEHICSINVSLMSSRVADMLAWLCKINAKHR